MKIKLLLFYLLISTCALAQYEVTIDAQLVDAENNEPLPFANIGFKDKAIGTVSNEDGNFTLNFMERSITSKDTLVISQLGYFTQSISAKNLFKSLAETKVFQLKPKVNQLPETMITSAQTVPKTLGFMSKDEGNYGYWKDNRGLGGEIATVIPVRNKNTRLKAFNFNVIEKQSDSILIRLNLYTISNGTVGTSVLNENIYYTISEKGQQTIDLKPYNLKVDDDIVASIELLKVHGKDIEFAVAGAKRGKLSFTRLVSQSNWISQPGTALAFSLDASIQESNNFEADLRTAPKDILVLWDSSLSRDTETLENELELLEKYLKSLDSNIKVTVKTFNNAIQDVGVFNNSTRDRKTIIDNISSLDYLGSSSLPSDLSLNYDLTLLFTDGFFKADLNKAYNTNLFTVSASKKTDHNLLSNLSFINDGLYINLSKNNLDKALKQLRYTVDEQEDYTKYKERALVTGVVKNGDTPIKNAKVRVKGTLIETTTNEKGEYQIPAEYDDVLVVNHLFAYPKESVVDSDLNVDLELSNKYESLDTINLQSSKLQTSNDEYDEKTRRIKAVQKRVRAHGIATTLLKEDFNSTAIDFLGLIRGKFSGVTIIPGAIPKVIVRGRSSINGNNNALFVVDGVQLNDVPDFLNPSQVESISLMKGLFATAQYGPAGSNGVFLVETTQGLLMNNGKKANPYLVVGNDYEENLMRLDPSLNIPNYLDDLKNQTTFLDAKKTYLELLQDRKNDVSFHADAYQILKIWNKEFALSALSNIEEVGSENATALTTYAYLLEEAKQDQKAVDVYKKILQLKPESAQAYLDLANAYRSNENFKEAYSLYKQMIVNDTESVDFSGLYEVLENEFLHLITRYRDRIPYQELGSEWTSQIMDVDVRLYFQWNDPQTEFSFQFVNPDKKFYEWKHTVSNRDLVNDNIEKGTSSKDFIIQDSEKGQWLVNLEKIDPIESNNPVYGKYTVYKNFGQPNENKIVKVIKLDGLKDKVNIDSFNF